jgi:hypothetical protein
VPLGFALDDLGIVFLLHGRDYSHDYSRIRRADRAV